MSKKTKKPILLILAGVVTVPIFCFIIIIAFYSITNPTISFKALDKPVPSDVVSAKQIEVYLNNEIQQIDKLSKYDLVIGSIDMQIDREHRGEVTAIFVEKDNKNPKVIFAHLDTREGIFYKFEDYGRESKLYPGIIDLKNWNIDSTDAVRITEEYFDENKDFRYNKIWVNTYSDSVTDHKGSEEAWLVYLTDTQNNVRYYARIDPYSGEVVCHAIDQGDYA